MEQFKCLVCGGLYNLEDVAYKKEPDIIVCRSCVDISAKVLSIING